MSDQSRARHWVLVVSRDHARRGLDGGFVMANHGKESAAGAHVGGGRAVDLLAQDGPPGR